MLRHALRRTRSPKTPPRLRRPPRRSAGTHTDLTGDSAPRWHPPLQARTTPPATAVARVRVRDAAQRTAGSRSSESIWCAAARRARRGVRRRTLRTLTRVRYRPAVCRRGPGSGTPGPSLLARRGADSRRRTGGSACVGRQVSRAADRVDRAVRRRARQHGSASRTRKICHGTAWWRRNRRAGAGGPLRPWCSASQAFSAFLAVQRSRGKATTVRRLATRSAPRVV